MLPTSENIMYKHKVQMISNCIGQRLTQGLATREYLKEFSSWFEHSHITGSLDVGEGSKTKSIKGHKTG